jgi:septal ring-binding cell division protein DamX
VSQAAAVAQGSGARPLRVGVALAGVVLAAVLLFSLGVMTGVRVAGRAPAPSAAGAPAVVATLPEPAAPPLAPRPVSAGSLTFYDRLSGAAPPLPAIQPDEPAQRAAEAAAPALAAPPAPPVTVAAAAKTPDAAQPAGADAGARVRKLMGKGPYAVQVAAVTDRAAAASLAERLRRQGLPAATIPATAKGRTWYRLRVGSFPSREAAARAAGLLHAELGLDATPVRD